jgi:hypothetical protein
VGWKERSGGWRIGRIVSEEGKILMMKKGKPSDRQPSSVVWDAVGKLSSRATTAAN